MSIFEQSKVLKFVQKHLKFVQKCFGTNLSTFIASKHQYLFNLCSKELLNKSQVLLNKSQVLLNKISAFEQN